MKMRSQLFLLAIASITIWSCKKEYVGKNSLVVQLPEPAGANCLSGGYKIMSGVDQNSNNVLDSNEIQTTNYVCNGNYDKETILFLAVDAGYYAATATGNIYTRGIENFDIRNYLTDSVTFSGYLYTNNSAAKCFVELYDLTNNKVISNSTISSNSLTDEFKTSVNLVNSFPKGPVNLGVKLRSEKDGATVFSYKPQIRIYRK